MYSVFLSYVRQVSAMIVVAQAPLALASDFDGFQGHWRAPDKSVIEIRACNNGSSLCGFIVYAGRYGHDDLNPDPALRTRAICGLNILTLTRFSNGVWRQGTVYNPEDGKSYSAALRKLNGNLLLRGYIGAEVFGETETWTAASDFNKGCTP